MTPRAVLIQSGGAAISLTPVKRKRIGGAQLVARREKEEGSAGAVWDAELAQRFHHRLHAAMVGRDGEHSKCFPSELPLVLFAGMGRQIRAHFFFEAGLSKGIRAHDRHSAAVEYSFHWRDEGGDRAGV